MKEPFFDKATRHALSWGLLLLLPLLFFSCSESNDEVVEYEDWQQRNETFFSALEDSLAANPSVWLKFKSYAKDQSLATGKNTDCIYVKVIPLDKKKYIKGDTLATPCGTDSVLVTYEGRLIPSASYPKGYVFDTRAYGSFSIETNATERFSLSSNLVDGFATALQQMHRGDYWRVYVPYQLGYKNSELSSIPAYSTLIFDLILLDFSPTGKNLPVSRTIGIE